MVLRLLFSPITAPFEGLIWLGEQILERADTEHGDQDNLKKQLLSLQLAFDMGDISEEDFEAQEEALLMAIEALELEAEQENEGED